MEAMEIIRYCRDDASKWAEQFRKKAIELGYSDMDEDWLFGWFANVIEQSDIYRAQCRAVYMGGVK